MAPFVNYLLEPEFDSQHHVKKPSIVLPTFNPSTGEMKKLDPWISLTSQSSLFLNTRPETLSEKKVNGCWTTPGENTPSETWHFLIVKA